MPQQPYPPYPGYLPEHLLPTPAPISDEELQRRIRGIAAIPERRGHIRIPGVHTGRPEVGPFGAPVQDDEETKRLKRHLAEQEKLQKAQEAAELEHERARNSQRGASTRYLDKHGMWSDEVNPLEPRTVKGGRLPPLTAKQIQGLPRPETIPEDQWKALNPLEKYNTAIKAKTDEIYQKMAGGNVAEEDLDNYISEQSEFTRIASLKKTEERINKDPYNLWHDKNLSPAENLLAAVLYWKRIIKPLTPEDRKYQLLHDATGTKRMSYYGRGSQARLPFVGMVAGLKDFTKLKPLVDAIASGHATGDQIEQFGRYVAEQEIGGEREKLVFLADVMSTIPAWGIEIYYTGGVVAPARKLTEKLLTRLPLNLLKKKGMQTALKGVSFTAGHSARLFTPVGGLMFARQLADDSIPQAQLGRDDLTNLEILVKDLPSKGRRVFNAIGKTWAELFTEQLGAIGGKAIGKVGLAAVRKSYQIGGKLVPAAWREGGESLAKASAGMMDRWLKDKVAKGGAKGIKEWLGKSAARLREFGIHSPWGEMEEELWNSGISSTLFGGDPHLHRLVKNVVVSEVPMLQKVLGAPTDKPDGGEWNWSDFNSHVYPMMGAFFLYGAGAGVFMGAKGKIFGPRAPGEGFMPPPRPEGGPVPGEGMPLEEKVREFQAEGQEAGARFSEDLRHRLQIARQSDDPADFEAAVKEYNEILTAVEGGSTSRRAMKWAEGVLGPKSSADERQGLMDYMQGELETHRSFIGIMAEAQQEAAAAKPEVVEPEAAMPEVAPVEPAPVQEPVVEEPGEAAEEEAALAEQLREQGLSEEQIQAALDVVRAPVEEPVVAPAPVEEAAAPEAAAPVAVKPSEVVKEAPAPVAPVEVAPAEVAPIEEAAAPEAAAPVDRLQATYPELGERYTEDAGVKEGYTVGEHTRRVSENWATEKPPNLDEIGEEHGIKNLDRLLEDAVALHDIGKGGAVKAGDKKRQHEFTEPILRDILAREGHSPAGIDLATKLIVKDVIGSYLKGEIKSSDAVKEITDLAESLNMRRGDVLAIATSLYKADATDYPALKEKIFGKGKPVEFGILEEAIHGEVLDSSWVRWFREDSTGDNATVGEADRYAPFVHGAAVVFREVDPGKDTGRNLIGPGFYVLAEKDEDIADRYARRAIRRVMKLFKPEQRLKLAEATPEEIQELIDGKYLKMLRHRIQSLSDKDKREAELDEIVRILEGLRDGKHGKIVLTADIQPREVFDFGAFETDGRVLKQEEMDRVLDSLKELFPESINDTTLRTTPFGSQRGPTPPVRAFRFYRNILELLAKKGDLAAKPKMTWRYGGRAWIAGKAQAQFNQALLNAGYDASSFIHPHGGYKKPYQVLVSLDPSGIDITNITKKVTKKERGDQAKPAPTKEPAKPVVVKREVTKEPPAKKPIKKKVTAPAAPVKGAADLVSSESLAEVGLEDRWKPLVAMYGIFGGTAAEMAAHATGWQRRDHAISDFVRRTTSKGRKDTAPGVHSLKSLNLWVDNLMAGEYSDIWATPADFFREYDQAVKLAAEADRKQNTALHDQVRRAIVDEGIVAEGDMNRSDLKDVAQPVDVFVLSAKKWGTPNRFAKEMKKALAEPAEAPAVEEVKPPVEVEDKLKRGEKVPVEERAVPPPLPAAPTAAVKPVAKTTEAQQQKHADNVRAAVVQELPPAPEPETKIGKDTTPGSAAEKILGAADMKELAGYADYFDDLLTSLGHDKIKRRRSKADMSKELLKAAETVFGKESLGRDAELKGTVVSGLASDVKDMSDLERVAAAGTTGTVIGETMDGVRIKVKGQEKPVDILRRDLLRYYDKNGNSFYFPPGGGGAHMSLNPIAVIAMAFHATVDAVGSRSGPEARSRGLKNFLLPGRNLGAEFHRNAMQRWSRNRGAIEKIQQLLADLNRQWHTAYKKKIFGIPLPVGGERVVPGEMTFQNISEEHRVALTKAFKIRSENLEAAFDDGTIDLKKELLPTIREINRYREELDALWKMNMVADTGVSEEAAAEGAPVEEILAFDKELWLTRTYRVFDDPKWGRWVMENMKDEVERFKELLPANDLKRREARAAAPVLKAYKKKISAKGGLIAKARKLWKKEGLSDEEVDVMAANYEGALLDAQGKVIRERIKLEPMTESEITGHINDMLGIKGAKSRVQKGTRTSMGRQDHNIFLARKFRDESYNEFEQLYRQLLGEHKDPIITVLRSVEKLGSFLAAYDTQQHIIEMNKSQHWFSDTKSTTKGGFTEEVEIDGKLVEVYYSEKIPDNKEFGLLRGKWATEDLHKALADYFGSGQHAEHMNAGSFVTRWFVTAWGTSMGVAKLSKTVYNVITHGRNVVGNISVSMTAGHFFRFSNWHEAFAAVDQNMTKRGKQTIRGKAAGLVTGYKPDLERLRDFVQDAIKRGAMGDNAVVTEISDLLTKSWGMGVSAYAKMDSPSQELGLTPKLVKGAKGILQKIHNAHMRWYQAEDDVWKVLGYLCEIKLQEKAFPEKSSDEHRDEAARRIRNTYPTGSNAAEAVKWIRWNPFTGTFPTWWYEMMRTQVFERPAQMLADLNSGNAVLKRHGQAQLVRYAGLAGMMYALKPMMEMLIRSLMGWEPYDDEENEDHRPLGFPWDEDADVSRFLTPEGNVMTMAWGNWFPPHRFNDMLTAWKQGETTTGGFMKVMKSGFDEFVGMDMVFMNAARALFNIEPGRKGFLQPQPKGHFLINPEDPDQFLKRIGWYIRKTYSPGHLRSVHKLGLDAVVMKALGKEVDPEREEEIADSRVIEFLKMSTGLSLVQEDPEKSGSFNSAYYHDKLGALSGLVHGAMRDKKTSVEEFEATLKQVEYQRRVYYEKLYKIARALEKSGMTKPEVRVLFARRFAKDAAKRIVYNGSRPNRAKYVPFEMDKDARSYKDAKIQDKPLAVAKFNAATKHRVAVSKMVTWEFSEWKEP